MLSEMSYYLKETNSMKRWCWSEKGAQNQFLSILSRQLCANNHMQD